MVHALERVLLQSSAVAMAAVVALLAAGIVPGPAWADTSNSDSDPCDTICHPPGPIGPLYYVALGDSFSSGTGARASGESYFTDMPACRRSGSSYPQRLYQSLADRGTTTNFINVTCHGKNADEIAAEQVPQIPQNTRVVTVTGGGNNRIATVNDNPERKGFSGILSDCIASASDCTVVLSETAVRTAVSFLYRSIQQRINQLQPNGPIGVYVLAYPRIFNSAGCTGISAVEAERLNLVTDQFNRLIRDEVSKVNASYGFVFVNTKFEFGGHESCTSAPWVTNLESPFITDTAESYHPNPTGHEALFKKVDSTIQFNPPV